MRTLFILLYCAGALVAVEIDRHAAERKAIQKRLDRIWKQSCERGWNLARANSPYGEEGPD